MSNTAQSSAQPSALPVATTGAVPDFSQFNFAAAQKLAPLAQQIREDPVALQRLGDRVFQLLEQEIRIQRERSHPHRRR